MTNENRYAAEYPVRLNELAPDAGVRGWTILNYLQDAAGAHADRLGLGLRQLRSHHLIWVLSRIRFRLDEVPSYGDRVRVVTWPSGFDRLFAYRQFRMESAETGRCFGVAGSAWLTLDPDSFRPVSPEKHLQGLPHWIGEEDRYFQGDTLGKLRTPDDFASDLVLEHRVSAAEIDYNRHLNNAYYAMLAEDWLGEKTGALMRMRELQINFNASTPFQGRLLIGGTLDGDGNFRVEGTRQETGKNAFQACGRCEKIAMTE